MKKANLKEMTTKLKYLNSDEQLLIYRLSKKHEYKIELLEGAQPHHTEPFSIPAQKTEVH